MTAMNREQDYRDKEIIVGDKHGRLPKAPNEPFAGFVPIVPGRRDLDHSVESVAAAIDRAVSDGRTNVTLGYEPHYCANYYGLRRALGEEITRIRGGWFAPLRGQLVLVVDFALRKRENPVGYKQPMRSCGRTHKCDIDNMAKTFLDALVQPWAVVVPKGGSTARKPIRTLVDDDRIVKLDALKHDASRGEMAGAWFAVDAIGFDEDAAETAARLTMLLDKAKQERRGNKELRAFDRLSLEQANEDGDAFLVRCGLDPVGRSTGRGKSSPDRPLVESCNPVVPSTVLTERQFLSLLGR